MSQDNLTFEKMRISERLASLEKSVEMYTSENSREHDEIKSLLKKFDENIFGNGKPGLTTKVAKLEDSADVRKSLLIILYAAVTGLIAQRVWAMLVGH